MAAIRQVAEELTVRESMIFLDGREFTGEPPGLRTVERGPLMLVRKPRLLSVIDGREVELFGRLAGHAKIRAGWLAASRTFRNFYAG